MSPLRPLDDRKDGIDYSAYQNFLDFVQKRKTPNIKTEYGENYDSRSYRVAPLFTSQVHAFAVQHVDAVASTAQCTYPQYGLLGSVVDGGDDSPTIQNLVFGNTSEPWSVFICGSQGSGKSYTLSCLLENALLKHSAVNVTQCPATGIVFHYDQFSSASSGQLCEAAYLCSTGVPVTVLVCPTSLGTMKKRYENLLCPGHNSSPPRVRPFYLKDEQLSTEIMMTLMGVDDLSERTPLYIASIRQLLRQMILDKPNDPVFDHRDFLRRLDQLCLTKDQLAPLSLRLDLLKSVLVDTTNSPHLRTVYDEIWRPRVGSLTIVDLSDPFVTESDACALFSISLKLLVGGWRSAPRIIALDEAHKFLKSSLEAQKLTSDLISVIRQQRHLGSRVIIATQEPTVSGELLALCNASIIHRFTSPQWYHTLRQHLIAAYGNEHDHSLLRAIAELDAGQAMVFCPTAILDVDVETGRPKLLRDAYFKLAVRSRVSADGGESILPAHRVGSTSDKCIDKNACHDDVNRPDGRLVGMSPDQAPGADGVSCHANIGEPVSTTQDGESSSHTLWLKTISTTPAPHDDFGSVVTSKSSDDGASIAGNAATNPIAMVYRTRRWTESELERLIYNQVRLLLGPKPVKDPWPVVVSPAFKALEKVCGVPERFFADNELGGECRDRRPIDMMKRLLKRYYDELRIPRDQRAAKKWLRD